MTDAFDALDALAEYDADRARFERSRFSSILAVVLYEARTRARRAARVK